MKLKNLATVTNSEFEAFLNSFDAILCDCDGVTWQYKTAISGVKESLKTLREHGKRISFVSNNNTVNLETFHEDLNNCGFDAKIDDIFHPTSAIIHYLKSIRFDRTIFIIGTTQMKNEFSQAGFAVDTSNDNQIEENARALGNHVMKEIPNMGAVVCDIDFNANFVKMQKALYYLKREDVLFITGANDKTFTAGLPVKVIGPGYFQSPLEDISGREPIRFGKPAKTFNDYIVEKLGIKDPSRVLLIGDSLEQDIGFASRYGYQKLLALTGITSLEDAEKCTDESMIPDYYVHSLGDLHELIRKKLKEE